MSAIPECSGLARPNVFEVDLEVVAECTRAVRSLIGPGVFFFATLKANAYGYGVLPAARTVLKSGAQAISLASVEDAVLLRQAGIQAPILLYAGVPLTATLVEMAERHDLIVTLHSSESLREVLSSAKCLKVAVKVDVGAERIGVTPEDAISLVTEVCRHPGLSLQVLNGHPNLPPHGTIGCLEWQYRNFARVCESLEDIGIEVPYRVLASSRVLRMVGSSMSMNAVDPGDTLFASMEADPKTGERKSAFRALRSRLIQVRTAVRDAWLEEAPFSVRPGMRIGVLPIGYADGVSHLHCGYVLVDGKRAPLLGKPALEYTRIDLSGIPSAQTGDEVVIIGSQADASISAHEVSVFQGASRVADLAMEIRPSVTRVYLQAAG